MAENTMKIALPMNDQRSAFFRDVLEALSSDRDAAVMFIMVKESEGDFQNAGMTAVASYDDMMMGANTLLLEAVKQLEQIAEPDCPHCSATRDRMMSAIRALAIERTPDINETVGTA